MQSKYYITWALLDKYAPLTNPGGTGFNCRSGHWTVSTS